MHVRFARVRFVLELFFVFETKFFSIVTRWRVWLDQKSTPSLYSKTPSYIRRQQFVCSYSLNPNPSLILYCFSIGNPTRFAGFLFLFLFLFLFPQFFPVFFFFCDEENKRRERLCKKRRIFQLRVPANVLWGVRVHPSGFQHLSLARGPQSKRARGGDREVMTCHALAQSWFFV